MKTFKNNIQNKLIIKKSKFIANLIKVNTEEECLNIINNIKKQYKDATHYCYAYIIDNIKRFNDDNEPSKTAGIPILNILEKNNLNYVLAIVIRYFGGIKLGTGGLIRAYSKVTNDALKKSKIIELVKSKIIELSFYIKDKKQIDYIINNYQIINKIYNNNKVSYLINVDINKIEKLKQQLKILNNINIKKIKDSYLEK